MELTTHHAKSYGSWAGNERGSRPDPSRCAESVYPNDRGPIPHQCHRKRGFGPEGAYCKQHDPEYVAEKKRKAHERYKSVINKEREQWWGPKFLSVLKQIADGHNDPRSLAADVIAEFERSAQ